jgi:hypothetical protein
MKQLFFAFFFAMFATGSYAASGSYLQQFPHHQLFVTLLPGQHALKVEDQITLPRGAPRTVYFTLHRGLHPTSEDAEIKQVGETGDPLMTRYSVEYGSNRNSFTISYGGEIFHPLQQEIREARSFEITPGIISEEGVVLSEESGWYPRLELAQSKGKLNFTLDVEMPRHWRAISQGAKREANHGGVVWQERTPQNGIHLIAGHFKEYDLKKDGVHVIAYLRDENLAMARSYLDAAVRYINMYQKLIGPYPYPKFALVENFWETGFGMPSFTLLGSRVIRLPFIINSSYPHEILHNWWGNGVYVDYSKGNWSEGLTAYLSDHLIQEQKGSGASYRRAALQKYANFVSTGRDFPLAKFTSRNSASSEAVGYGKAMMMFHMLRRQMEDDRYTLALQKIYSIYRFTEASYSDLEQLFSQAAGKDFKPFFAQWTQRTGAPRLRLVSAQQEDDGDGYEVIVKIEQIQPEEAYQLEVPIAITLAGDQNAFFTVISMKDKQAEAHIPLKGKPLRVDIDPEYDLFRRLDDGEMPAAFSQVMGAEVWTVVLPSKAPEELRKQYLNLAQAWQREISHTTQIKWDDEIDRLPAEGAAWLLGWENKFQALFQSTLNPGVVRQNSAGIELGGKTVARGADALALASQVGQIPVAWLAVPRADMLPSLAKKLPHYAKYSYAAFNGEEVVVRTPVYTATQPKTTKQPGFPVPRNRGARANTFEEVIERSIEINNIAKGVWPVTNSPLAMSVRQVDGSVKNVVQGNMPERTALAR